MHPMLFVALASFSRRQIAGCAALALAVSTASLQAGSSTIVGFYNVTVPAGNSAWVCGLVTTDAYQGAATMVTADVDGKALVSFADTGWTGGDFPLPYAEPQSGTSAGLAVDVLSNT